jgi:diacylglycerol kinase (ATP)
MTEDKNKQNEHTEIPDYEEYRPQFMPMSIVASFRYAVDGILDVFRTQKHMRFHFVTVVAVLLAALFFGLDQPSMLVLLFTISMVLVAEMFNTAIEAVVDLITQTYHPLAKFAKDAAAGAVLIATSTAVLIGFLLFIQKQPGGLGELRPEEPGFIFEAGVVGVVLLVLVIIIKARGRTGKLLRGGIISGHAVVGFFLAATILFVSKSAFTAILGLIMALLIAQSRVQSKIHSLQEVTTGAVVAMLVTGLVYWLTPGWWSWIVPWFQKVTHIVQ